MNADQTMGSDPNPKRDSNAGSPPLHVELVCDGQVQSTNPDHVEDLEVGLSPAEDRQRRREERYAKLHAEAASLLPGRPEAIDEARVAPLAPTRPMKVAPSYHSDIDGLTPIDESPRDRARRRKISAAGLTIAVGSLAMMFLGRGTTTNPIPEALARADDAQTGFRTASEAVRQVLPTNEAAPTSTTVEVAAEPPREPVAEESDDLSIDYPDRDRLVRHAVFSQGKLTLRGQVPTQAVADVLTTEAQAIFGASNVVSEYTIDPDALNPATAPIFVTDGVVFNPGTTEVAAESTLLLNLSAVLITRNPGVQLRVLGYSQQADTTGANQLLATARVQAIIDFVDAAGADASQVVTEVRGEEPRLATSDSEQGEVGIEFVISGLAG